MNTKQPMKRVRTLPGCTGWDSFANQVRGEQGVETFLAPAHMRTEGSSWLEDVEPGKTPPEKAKTDADLV